MLSFTLLGQTVLSKNGVPLDKFRSQKEAALLIYLAQTGQLHQRDFIAELLWDARSTKQSLSNLRTALARLRKQVGDELLITRTTVVLDGESLQQIDSVQLLQTLAAVGQIDSDDKATSLQKALDTYHGDFLADFYLSDTPQFDEWVVVTREHIRRQIIAACHKLGQYALTKGKVELGNAVARRWLEIDDLDEAAHILLIQLFFEAGHEHEAVAHYGNYVERLQKELGVKPSAEMTALLKPVRPARFLPIRSVTAVSHNLPPAYNQFFGRKTVQQEIHARLDQPWCRLVTITGQGGVGKTRLSTAIARSRLSQYRDGVWLIELDNLDPEDDDLAEAIAVEIASTLDMRLTGAATPIAQLLDHLQHKQMMLVLDNFEHLLAGVQLILDIVQRCEHVQMLISSREALKIQAEWTMALTGLSYPANDTDEMSSDAVDLFVARQAQHQHGVISGVDLTVIRAICRMVEGLPLAIELAAALTRQTPIQEVAHKLRDGFDTLIASLRDVPQRHQGLHIVFEMSWRTLTPALQQQLARLSIFRGGFMPMAAQQITEADVEQLAALADKSLVSHDTASGRFSLHPVIRAYAAAKREPADPTPHKHARYYLSLLAQHTEPLQKEKPQDSINLLEPDIDNIRRAWQTGLSERNTDVLYNALTPLSIYYQLRGLAHEGEAVMHNTVSMATTWAGESITLATRAGLEWSRFQNRLGQCRPALHTIQRTLKLADQCDDRWAEGMGHVLWGESLWRLGEYDLAKEKLDSALGIANALDALLIIGWCHHQLGIIHDIQSRYYIAHKHFEKACATWREIGNLQALSGSLNSIGLVCHHQGDLTAAQQAMEQALAICEQLDDRHRQSSLVNNLSIILLDQGDYAGSQYYLQLGLELANTNGNLTGQGEIYTNLGKTYRLLGEIDLAVESLEQGLRISESIGNHSLLATAMLILAETKREQGDLKQAKSLYDQTLKITRQDNLQGIECEALIGIAELLREINEKQAGKYSAEAVALAEVIQNPQLIERAKIIDQALSVSVNLNEKNLPR